MDRLSGARTTLGALFLFAASPVVFAEPNITGTTGNFDEGQRITISGTGFGNKSRPGPLVWDDFEDGSDGTLIAGRAPAVENLARAWTWDDYTAQTHRPRYGNGRVRPNSSLSSEHDFIGGTYNNSLEIDFPVQNTGDEVYFSFYYYYDKISNNWSRNHKPWIVYGNTGYYPAAYDGWGNPSDGDGTFRNSVQDSGDTGQTLWSSPELNQVEGEWIRIEGFLRVSGPNQNNGAWNLWVHRPDAPSPNIRLEQFDDSYKTRSGNNFWQQWHFGSYHDNGPTNAEARIYIDDLYFDDTQARIELCDRPTWVSCTQREHQIPVNWSANSVEFEMNAGAFATAEDVYLYVVDAQGSVNPQGFPVRVGAASAVRPNPPTDLQASAE